MEIIRETLKKVFRCSITDEAEFERKLREAVAEQKNSDENENQQKLSADRTRMEELELLLCKIYEDNALGKLPDSRYQYMKKQYETEQAGIRDEIEELEKNVVSKDNRELSVAKFTALIRKYRDFEELTTPMLIEFIDKILVHEREYKGRPNSPQKVEIIFNFVGKVDFSDEKPALSPEEIAEAEKIEQWKQRRHEQYLRRKESGWQGEYYQKIKAAKKATIDAAKEAIRAEDRANGVYYLPNQTTVSAG